MEITDLTVQIRKEQKKGPARRLRQQGFVPAIFYGSSADNILLAVKNLELIKLHKNKKDQAFIKLIIDDGREKTEKLSIIKELQVNPLTGKFYHADFYEVDLTKKLTFEVSLNFTGKAVGVQNGGELQRIKHTVKISCLPADLPESIQVDVSALEIGHSIKVRDIKAVSGISILDTPDASIVAVAAVRVTKTAATEAAQEEGASAEEAQTADDKKEK